ncbi:hypothetical protein [Psychroserpens sp. MEBiC05023]
MKNRVLLFILLVAFSCAEKENPLLGKWEVDSKYYRAIYNIIKSNDSVKGKVLYYNDDTTIIRESDGKDYYIFMDLKEDEGIYVDAISGATKSNDIKPNIELNLIHLDTLDVTTYIRNKPLKEIWIRVKE